MDLIILLCIVIIVSAGFFGYLASTSGKGNQDKLQAGSPDSTIRDEADVSLKQKVAIPLAPAKPLTGTHTDVLSVTGISQPKSLLTKEEARPLKANVIKSTAGPDLIAASLIQNLGKIGAVSLCTFQQRFEEFQDQVVRLASLITYWDITDFSSPHFQLVCNRYIVALVNSLLPDAHDFNHQVKKATDVKQLKGIRASLMEVQNLVEDLHDALEPDEEALRVSNSLTDLLKDTIKEADGKIQQIHTASFRKKTIPDSEQLFNLGFYLMNSRDQFVPSRQKIAEEPFGFKPEFFPTFAAIKLQDYVVAKSLLDSAFEVDPTNVLAEIYREVACLNAALRSEDVDYDRQEIIQNLHAIIARHPQHALGYIELAHAYASVSDYALAEQYTEQALAICSGSTYVKYSAMLVYRNLYDRKKEAELLGMLAHDTYETNNPRLYYFEALALMQPDTILLSFPQIEKAVKYGKSMDYFRLRKEILDILEFKLSDKDFDSLGGPEIVRDCKRELRLLENREEKFKMEHVDFKEFTSITFSPDCTSVDILAQRDEPLHLQLSEGKGSVVFLDFDLTFAEVIPLEVLAVPSVITGGKYFIESEANATFGTVYLKGLDFESFFKKGK